MWMFTKHGMFSVVQVHGDPERVLVRARAIEHLEALQKRFMRELKLCYISKTPDADYMCRMTVDKDVWAEIVKMLSNEIDYSNFKATVPAGWYEVALHSVWRTYANSSRQ